MKKIEVVYLKPSDIQTNFGNPRKITKQQYAELKKSIETLGDFRNLVIDEYNNVIAGNQRLSVMKDLNIDTPILCKKLIGYTDAEKKAINIKDNMSSGEFDDVLLAEWEEEIKIEIPDIELPDIEVYNMSDIQTSDTFSLKDGDKAPFQQMTFTLANKQADFIKNKISEIKKTQEYKQTETYGNENSNGNALYVLIRMV